MADELARHGMDARVYHLKSLDSEGELSVAEAARRLPYQRALKATHDALRKVGR
jgi:hypothetical protein